MGIEHLPTEILGDIFLYLECPRDLGNLSRCSKRLHWLCVPFLYATLKQTQRGAPPSFIRTLMEKPHLINYVRNIEVSAFPGSLSEATIRVEKKEAIVNLSSLPAEQKGRIRLLLRDRCLGASICGSWYQSLLAGFSWNALVAFILLLCSHTIETFTIEHWGVRTPSPNFLSQFIRSSIHQKEGEKTPKGSISFPNLRRAKVLCSPARAAFGTEDDCHDIPYYLLQVESHFDICLERFCYGCMIPFETWPKREYSLRCRKISFISCEVSFCDVSKVLTRCDSLERFECHFACTSEMHRYRDLSEIKQGLLRSKNSLESLVLAGPAQAPYTAYYPNPPFRVETSLGSLNQFERLRVIDIEA